MYLSFNMISGGKGHGAMEVSLTAQLLLYMLFLTIISLV